MNNHEQQQQMGSSSFHPQHMGHHILNGGMTVQVINIFFFYFKHFKNLTHHTIMF